MDKLIDLHTHTTASDGTCSPKELIELCKKENICAVAVTDHDTCAALDECSFYAKQSGIELINGIELSCTYGGEMHMLGLFLDSKNPALKSACNQLKVFRKQRNEKIIEKLCAAGFKINKETVCSFTDSKNLADAGRVHIAKALIKGGYALSISDAFSKYLANGKPFYCKRETFCAQKCIDIIHQAGGKAFLAHPNHSAKDSNELDALLKILISYGLDGVECFHSSMPDFYSKKALALCKKYNLLVSAGSDFHGENKPDVHIGKTFNQKPISPDILKNIKQTIY